MQTIENIRTLPSGAVIADDRTPEEKQATIGYWVATDKFMSGWGQAQGRSIVACPIVSSEDSDIVEKRFLLRNEFKRVRFIPNSKLKLKLYRGDHLHIYNTVHSFRYAL